MNRDTPTTIWILRKLWKHYSAAKWMSSHGDPSAILASPKLSKKKLLCSMRPRSIKRLEDARDACSRIQEFTCDVSLDSFLASDLLRSARSGELRFAAAHGEPMSGGKPLFIVPPWGLGGSASAPPWEDNRSKIPQIDEMLVGGFIETALPALSPQPFADHLQD